MYVFKILETLKTNYVLYLFVFYNTLIQDLSLTHDKLLQLQHLQLRSVQIPYACTHLSPATALSYTKRVCIKDKKVKYSSRLIAVVIYMLTIPISCIKHRICLLLLPASESVHDLIFKTQTQMPYCNLSMEVG